MTGYEMRKYLLLDMLETYRDTPPGEPGRRFIDRLIEGSRNAAGDSPEEKRLHNLIVLRYITGTRPTTQRICAALHMGRQRANYEAVTANAVDRLLVLAFGADGIDWNESEQLPRRPAAPAAATRERSKRNFQPHGGEAKTGFSSACCRKLDAVFSLSLSSLYQHTDTAAGRGNQQS